MSSQWTVILKLININLYIPDPPNLRQLDQVCRPPKETYPLHCFSCPPSVPNQTYASNIQRVWRAHTSSLLRIPIYIRIHRVLTLFSHGEPLQVNPIRMSESDFICVLIQCWRPISSLNLPSNPITWHVYCWEYSKRGSTIHFGFSSKSHVKLFGSSPAQVTKFDIILRIQTPYPDLQSWSCCHQDISNTFIWYLPRSLSNSSSMTVHSSQY